MLMEDAEHVVRLLSELEPLEEWEDDKNDVGIFDDNRMTLFS